MMTTNTKIILLLLFSATIIVALFFMDPIAQDPAYHLFVDQQSLLGIPHFWNVLSNIGFLIAGLWAFRAFASHGFIDLPPDLKSIGWVFVIGIFCTGFGSAYYHWNPNNTTLVWDRLPMTLAFMAFFTLVIAERIGNDIGKKLFAPLLVIGLFSVTYWHYTEQKGIGDLRLYALVQFLPILLIPVLLLAFPKTHQRNHFYWLAILFYLLAKLTEFFDRQIYELLQIISGHSLKHLLAAIGGSAVIARLVLPKKENKTQLAKTKQMNT